MAVNYFNQTDKSYEFSGFPIGFSRNNPIPLDKTEIWIDFEELKAYATSDPTAYVGQKVTYVDVVNKTATVYTIADEEGTLQPVGAPTEGDEVTISLDNGILSLKDFGKRYYEFIPATEASEGVAAVEAHYELVEVDDSHPWAAGLTLKVVDEDGTLVLGWFEPNETTIEGVQDQANTALEKAEAAESKITEVEEQVADVENRVDQISNTLNDTTNEAGEKVEGLVTRVTNLEADVADLYDAVDDVYTKEEIDGKIASVFHYKGKKATYAELLLTEGAAIGDVWEVTEENKEYAWNGSEWVELGSPVDLSAYATTEYVNGKVKTLQDNIDAINTTVGQHTEQLANQDKDIQTLKDDVAPLKESVADINSTIAGYANFDDRIGTLEDYVGTPSKNLGALYPVIESLSDRVNSFEETLEGQGFGEFNKLETLTINGTLLTPNEAKTIDLPIFAGTTSGLVPVANALDNTYYLNAAGEWSVPMDSRIGDLGDFVTVVEYVDNAINVALTWSEIGN